MSGARVLVVEDHAVTAQAVAFALRSEGFAVELAADGAAALETARAHGPELVVLDVGLPDISGLEVCRALREDSAVPILMLTARGSELDTVIGLERGADDYMVKPFSLAELVARVRALLRGRALAGARSAPVCRVGDLRIDVSRHEVVLQGSPVHTTPSEFRLLAFLAERAGEAVTRRELCTRLWGTDCSLDTRACDLHVARLRRKIEPDPARPRRLLTVRAVGYKLVAG